MNAKIWTIYKGSPVKLKIKPDQDIELIEGGPTDEGHSVEYNHFTNNGEAVIRESGSYGRDCDGGYEHHYKHICPVTKCGSIPDNPESQFYDPDYRLSPWKIVDESHRDQYAELMGY